MSVAKGGLAAERSSLGPRLPSAPRQPPGLSGGIEENPRPKDAGFVPFVTRAAGKPLAHHQRPTIRLRFLFSPQAGAPMNLDVLLPQPLTEEERLECLLQRRLGSRIRNVRVQLLPHGRVL